MVEAWYHTISVHGACEISVHVKNVGAELMVDGNSTGYNAGKEALTL